MSHHATRPIFFIIFLITTVLYPFKVLAVFKANNLLHAELVRQFYQQNNASLFWFGNESGKEELRQFLKQLIDSCQYDGLDKYKYHYEDFNETDMPKDSLASQQLDKIYTDAAITYLKDIYQGANIAQWVRYDELSGKCTKLDNVYILTKLSAVKTKQDLDNLINNLTPDVPAYKILKQELALQIAQKNSIKIYRLKIALNMQRWIHHFRFKKAIVVNVAATTLRYFEDDSLLLHMKIVAGKPATPTPRFAAYCNQVVFYPYWHVPRSIAVNEILPSCKKSRSTLSVLGLQVLDAHGHIVNPRAINWQALNRHNFPYTFRQSTGCDNALGVIKFNLTDPFNVYLHDTNLKSFFRSNYRFYSHGCMRIEKPVELANYLLVNTVDTTFLNACIKGQTPIVKTLDDSVPVFVIYSLADVNTEGAVVYYADVYHLF